VRLTHCADAEAAPQEKAPEVLAGDFQPAAGQAACRRVRDVADNLVNGEVAKVILTKCQYRVATAENGLEALELLETESFDLVFMDVEMPEMDGFEATGEIRANPRWQHLPIIAMTAHATEGDRQRCLEAGMDDYLTKPLQARQLREMADRWASDVHPRRDPDSRDTVPAEPRRPLEIELALDQLGGDRGLFDEVLAMFLESAPTQLGDLRAALDRDDGAQLRLLAHSLKGAASNICAEPTRATAERLEQMGAEGETAAAEALLDELQQHLDRLRDHVESLDRS
ncbi:MAG: response regulator, partial [bacterium]|nr:response regulator [bacterium]